MEEDDDFYGDGEAAQTEAPKNEQPADGQQDSSKDEKMEESLEEGEEEEEDSSDSDVDIITERKDLVLPDSSHPRSASTNLNRAASSTEPSKQPIQAPPPTKGTQPGTTTTSTTAPTSNTPAAPQPHQKPGASYPEVHTSTIDVNANPIWEPANKPITALDIDADLAEHDKPWRRPGADQTDYFNYGFDEFTWASYCLRQQNMATALKDQKAETAKFEMMLAGGMPGMPPAGPGGAPTGPAAQQGGAGGMGGMPGMPGMPDEMMQGMMAQMMAQGITDPNQLTFDTFMQMQGMGAGGMPGGPPQGPAAQQGYGGGQQGQYGGYGGGGHQGGFGGRGGRGGRRW